MVGRNAAPASLPGLENAAPAKISFAPTRAAGLRRLAAFLPAAGRAYAAGRNHDLGPDRRGNVSALSPWIRHRLVTEEEVLVATLARHAPSSAEKFVQEVCWRGYFKGWLEQRPAVWTRYREGLAGDIAALDRDRALRRDYEAAVAGRTGIACFDAWAEELVATGYLHNHARMWFASIWIFTLRLPWRLGADFFYRHLLDGDPASNTLSWRWVGGLHTKGKTYLARPDNIARYTGGRFPRAEGLAPHAEPLTEEGEAPRIPPPQGDPFPEGARWGLLITEEDGRAESPAPPAPPAAILSLAATEGRSPLPVGALAAGFAAGALSDARQRAEAAFGVAAEAGAGDWAAALTGWARAHDLQAIVTPYAPVGPVADRLAAAAPALSGAGVRLVRRLRPYDARLWPHATAGFFKVKKAIPKLLAGLSAQS